MVLLDDVDFIVSGGLSDPEGYDSIVQRTRAGAAVVLPALEPADGLGIRNGTRAALKAVHGVCWVYVARAPSFPPRVLR